MADADVTLEVTVDDCWNRIGVRGDKSCKQLKTYFRCLNCPTFAAAAAALLDRSTTPLTLAEEASVSQVPLRDDADAFASMLIFRVGAEWLSLPTGAIVEVIEARAIHSLPHQRNPAVLGLTNIRGALKICVALAPMLGVTELGDAQRSRRALVVEHDQHVLVFPVDEVAGVHTYRIDALLDPPSTLQHSVSTYIRAMLSWRTQSIGLLDCGLLFYALHRSLT